jgi:hypothetical protein
MNQLTLANWTDGQPVEPTGDVHPNDVQRLSGQNGAILQALQGGPQTNADLIRLTGAMNFSARISNLRKAGHVIKCERLGGGVNRYELKG